MESKIFLDGKITGSLSVPELIPGKKYPLVLLFHGFAIGRDEVAGFYKILSEKFLENGIASLRVDFAGCGERNQNDQPIATINDQINDAVITYTYVTELPWVEKSKIGVCGFSMGAAVTLITSNIEDINYNAMVLISPAGNLYEDFLSFLGKEIFIKGKKLDIKENLQVKLSWREAFLSGRFFKELNYYDLYKYIKNYKGSLFSYVPENDFSYKHGKFYFQNCESSDKKFICVENTDHIFDMINNQESLKTVSDEVTFWIKSKLI